jgi:hypothetical protein
LLGRPRGPQRKQQLKKQEFIDQMKEGMLFALTHTAVSVNAKVKSLSLVGKKVCLFFCFYYHSTEISSLQNNLFLVVFYNVAEKGETKVLNSLLFEL